ncbi:LLM class flavin-dependent oxidoreductase [Nocardia sp. GCM10030253]|uniref:LLM class flavin-dependent oxidoreductase n=1 Tax=Nocardia sp. GCM10030253 TaxID=3273404 RepID=UPI0036280BF5
MRGRRADEAIDVMRLLWSGGPEGVGYHGEFFDFDDLCSFPETPRDERASDPHRWQQSSGGASDRSAR